jgi:radical SAM-linked protein
MQRLRISFTRGEELKFLSHLDLMRLWERAFRRAGLDLAYSEGFSPHPRIALAAPLAVGMTSQAELMDVTLSRWTSPQMFATRVEEQLPEGLAIADLKSVGLTEPSLQGQVRFAEYRVEVETTLSAGEIEGAIQSLLLATEMPWEHERDTGTHHYDLRPLIDDIWFVDLRDCLCVLGMRLRCGSSGAGRPEQVTRAMGISQRPHTIHRAKLIFN